jgi:hypothetical protein
VPAVPRIRPAILSPVPELAFAVDGSSGVDYAAVPTLSFTLRVQAPGGHPIRSLMLDVQIQIAARRRSYGPGPHDRLLELFGPPGGWSTTLRTLPWLRTTKVVPAFEGTTTVDLPVACTYDLQVTASRYLAALDDGAVPLEFLFSGSVFFATSEGALQTARIGWEHEVDYDMPIAVWKQAMDRHFPDSAWLRVGTQSFAALCAYKARHAFGSWDETIEALLSRAGPA